MPQRQRSQPCFQPFEVEACASGHRVIVGIDEAGRGPLAGPVVAAAACLPVAYDIPGLDDSKRLTASQRDTVYGRIQQQALVYGVGVVAHTQIDQQNILWATQQAMMQAVQQLPCIPDLLLIDGSIGLPSPIAQRLIVRGDACCASIAAASILAKVTRDRLMIAYSKRYPAYGFDRHKGYPTQDHYARLRTYGPCAIHRRSFRGVISASSSRTKGMS